METSSSFGPQVEFGPVEYQTKGSSGIICPPTHDTQLMGPPGYNNYPARAFFSHAGSEGDYCDYWGSGLYGFPGGSYPSCPRRGIAGDGTYGEGASGGGKPCGDGEFLSCGPPGPPVPQGPPHPQGPQEPQSPQGPQGPQGHSWKSRQTN